MALPLEAVRTASRARGWAWPLVAAAVALLPVLFWRGGVVEEEAIGFLRNYWGERPVLHRIFDPRGYDAFQARELSYAIDFLDAQWLRHLLSHDVLLFVAPSVLLASLATVLVARHLVPKALPGLSPAVAWLVVLVFLSNFAVASTAGLLYRATKPLVAPLLLFLLLFVLTEHRHPARAARSAFAAVFSAGLAMSLLDRQGLFYLVVVGLVLAAAWLRTRRGLPVLLGVAAAVAVWLVYLYLLGPWIIHSQNGYWPEMRFQRFRPAALLRADLWLEGARLLADWARVLFGGLPRTALGGAVVALAAGWAFANRRRPVRVAVAAIATLAALAAQVAMVAIMVWRHEPVTWIDHRFWYYPLPFQALLVFGLLWGLERLSVGRGSLPAAVPIALAGLVLANLAQWPERRAVMATGPWFGAVERRSALLVRSLRGGRAEPLLDGDYRRFFFECLDRFPRLRARADTQVSEGSGFEVAELQGGGVRALARREAHLVARARVAGPHVLVGTVVLRPGDALSVLQGSPPRLRGRFPRGAGGEGPETFRVQLDLPTGVSDLLLLSELPEREVHWGSSHVSGGFLLQLPVVVWRESAFEPRASERSAPPPGSP